MPQQKLGISSDFPYMNFSNSRTLLASLLLTLLLPDQIYNSPYSQPYNSYNASSENLVLDQQIIPKLLYFFILITYLVDIAFDIVRRNSVLVTHGS